MADSDDKYTEQETEQRLRKALHAAFNMKPTPLKSIPKKYGKDQPPRSGRKPKAAA